MMIDTIRLLVTSFCNLSCTHCYQHFEKNKFQLSYSKLLETISFAVENEVKMIDFSGGEFFVHPNAYDLLEYCFTERIPVHISTNAVDICTDFFKDKDLDIVSIQISLDGTEKTHDKRRGQGAYNKAIQNASCLNDMGIPISVNMALDEDNYLDALDILEMPLFYKYSFTPVAFTGAANRKQVTATYRKYEDTICYILRNTECENAEGSEIVPRNITIKYDGGVYPSPIASDYSLLCMGNIKEDELESIINRYLNGHEFQRLLQAEKAAVNECEKCSVKKECNGGSRLRALKFFGDASKPDPFYCRVFNQGYGNIPIGNLFWGENLNDNCKR